MAKIAGDLFKRKKNEKEIQSSEKKYKEDQDKRDMDIVIKESHKIKEELNNLFDPIKTNTFLLLVDPIMRSLCCGFSIFGLC